MSHNMGDIKIMVCTPVHSQVSPMYTKSLLELQKEALNRDVEVFFEFNIGSSIIHDSRNILADKFLHSDCTHLFFIDSDIIFSHKEFFEVVEFSNSIKDNGVVGGIYPKKSVNWELLYYSIQQGEKDLHNYIGTFALDFDFDNASKKNTNIDFSKPIEVSGIGTGFMCIRRETIEKLANRSDMKRYTINRPGHKPKLINSFFDFSIDENYNLVGEDTNFCRKCIISDMKVYALPWLFLAHEGNFIYRAAFSKVYDIALKYYTSGEYKNKKIKYK